MHWIFLSNTYIHRNEKIVGPSACYYRTVSIYFGYSTYYIEVTVEIFVQHVISSIPFSLSPASGCEMSCIIGVAVGVVVLIILVCLVIIVIAVKCHHKGMFSVLYL